MDNQYFIKKGYNSNQSAQTKEGDTFGEYWTEERIKSSAFFQYDVYKYAGELIQSKQLRDVMDLGCGPGTKAAKFLRPYTDNLLLVDQPSCENIVKETLPGIEFLGVDLECNITDLEKQFDVIVCADVIEHLHNPVPLLNFISKHLKPTGVVVLSTPERDILRGLNCMHSPHPAHVREWNESELKKLLQHHEFIILNTELLPPKKLDDNELFRRKLFGRFYRKAEWYSCQMVVAKHIGI